MPAPTRSEIERVFRREYGRVVSVLIHLAGDFATAQDLASDAFRVALERWPEEGMPDRPGAWLTTVARRRGLDRLRHERVAAQHQITLARSGPLAQAPTREEEVGYPDERLRFDGFVQTRLQVCAPHHDRLWVGEGRLIGVEHHRLAVRRDRDPPGAAQPGVEQPASENAGALHPSPIASHVYRTR